MKSFILLGLGALCCGCSSLSPYVSTSRDPFTAVSTRLMVVGPSQYQQLLAGLASASPYPYYYAPSRPASLPLNQLMSLTVSGRDTLLNLIRLAPERAYDVPAGAQLQLKLSAKDDDELLYDLPLVKSYHTTGGPLMVSGRVNQYVASALLTYPIEIVRVSQVSTNESDLLPSDWYLATDYARAFQQGSRTLLTTKAVKPVRKANKKTPTKPFKWGWQK